MEPEAAALPAAGPASLVVVDPNGQKRRVPVEPIPFLIGRQPDNHLIVRDSRVSRVHARILVENGEYVLEGANSRRGTRINGRRATRKKLEATDKIESGAQDSYHRPSALNGAGLNGRRHQ